jgi:pilus assembly protein CpaC
MKNIIITILLVSYSTILYGNQTDNNLYTIVEKQQNGATITLTSHSYKILEFSKRIKDVRLSNKENVELTFMDAKKKPLTKIQIFAKKIGVVSALITFSDKSISQINFNITPDIRALKEIVKGISKDVQVTQVDDNIILKGDVKNNKIKKKIISLFKHSTDSNTSSSNIKIIDLLKVKELDKMVRMKLYVVEMKNTKGKEIKNNWFISSKNYMESITEDGRYYNEPLNSTSNSGYNKANNQRNSLVSNAVDNMMKDAVSLTGGLTAAANYLGDWFNAGVTLNYLATQGVATVLDETELITLENKKSKFHAGGKVYVKTQTTAPSGSTTISLKEIKYGLTLEMKVNNILKDKYVDLTITTKQDKLNWSDQVDGVPGTSNQSINTFVVIKDKSTIVLGGLVNKNDAKNYWKIPMLGDIPILGELFKSKSFTSGNSELVFFIVPEIVTPENETNINLYKDKDELKDNNSHKKTKVVKKVNDKMPTNEQLHDQRVKEMFGI